MAPRYELLRLPAGSSEQAELRQLARTHPRARLAAHVSRSYCGGLGLVAWHSAPVGVDLERVSPADGEFALSICTPSEVARFADRLGDSQFVTSLWSSKEALAKALGDARAYDPRRLESPLGWSAGASGRWRARTFQPAPDHLAWLVWSVEPQNSSASAQNSSASEASASSTRLLAGRR